MSTAKINFNEILGEKVRLLRESLNITQTEMAVEIGTSSSRISRIESGIATISLSETIAICKNYDIELFYLTTDCTVTQFKIHIKKRTHLAGSGIGVGAGFSV